MTAWVVDRPGPMATHPLRRTRRPVPTPAEGELLLSVEACGVCRTDLHLAEGDLAPHHPHTTPGHQVVGVVTDTGARCRRFRVGDRVGVAWLRRTCQACRWCRAGRENLCPESEYTGWDADGGFAEFAVVPEAYAYRLPPDAPASELAPLLCAGIIGYRALRRARLPAGGRLGMYGFGSSAHITAQLALAQGAELYVATRGAANRQLASELGATWVGHGEDRPPAPLDSAIVFAPAGDLVPPALAALERGGTLALAGIHMSAIPALDYQRSLFLERDLRSVTSNTRRDGEELLHLAARLDLRPRVTTYALDDAADVLTALAEGGMSGSAVLTSG